jgi:phage/plasmid primase-like uncharacterized protein
MTDHEWVTSQGFTVKEFRPDGKIHRVPHDCKDKTGDDAGWYVADETPVPHVSCGCHRCGYRSNHTDNSRPLTDAEKAEVRRRAVDRERAIESEAAAVADNLSKNLSALPRATSDHPYLRVKGVGAHGALVHPEGPLIIPLSDVDGVVRSAQGIYPQPHRLLNGLTKSFEKGGKVAGCFYQIGQTEGAREIVVAEGFATAATIHEATGFPVLAAMSAGNLGPVVASITERYRDATIIVAADNDQATEGNPGVTQATKAARTYGAVLAVPDFGGGSPSKDETDFNDLSRTKGASEVKRQILAALESRKAPRVGGRFEVTLPDDFGQEMPQFLDEMGEAFNGVNSTHAGFPPYVQRGGRLTLVVGSGRQTRLIAATDSMVRCEVQRHVSVFKRRKSRGGKGELESMKAGEIPDKVARDVAGSTAVCRRLPEVAGVSTCPVLTTRGEVIANGYAPDLRIIVACDPWTLPELSVDEAAKVLLKVVDDFLFVAEADKSRAVAAIILPALVSGEHVARGPIMLVTADQRSAGKGTIVRMRSAIYGARLAVIACREGGVGGLDEDLATKLIDGSGFIGVDNIRGQVASQFLEAALTEDTVVCRKPYRAPQDVETAKVAWSATSNGVSLTEDLAARSCVVRLRKREPGYEFKMLNPYAWCVENRGLLLSAVFAIIRHWQQHGSPRAKTGWNDHHRDFWAVVDWILPNLFKLPPPTQGATDAAQNASDPLLELFRVVGLELRRTGAVFPTQLSAVVMLRLADDAGAQFDGKSIPVEDRDIEGMAGSVGGRAKRLFANRGSVVVEEFRVERVEVSTVRTSGGSNTSFAYRFDLVASTEAGPLGVLGVPPNSLGKGHFLREVVHTPSTPSAQGGTGDLFVLPTPAEPAPTPPREMRSEPSARARIPVQDPPKRLPSWWPEFLAAWREAGNLREPDAVGRILRDFGVRIDEAVLSGWLERGPGGIARGPAMNGSH